jgi:hypothetical protein
MYTIMVYLSSFFLYAKTEIKIYCDNLCQESISCFYHYFVGLSLTIRLGFCQQLGYEKNTHVNNPPKPDSEKVLYEKYFQ